MRCRNMRLDDSTISIIAVTKGSQMNISTQPRSASSYKPKILAVMAVAAVCMTGCQTTMHSRWAKPRDSVLEWSEKLPMLPIDVHGNAPGASAGDTLARIPNGTTDERYAAANQAAALRSAQRVELYVGGDTLPVNATYCSMTPTQRSVEIPAGKVMIAAALCDGSRLVVTAREEFGVDAASSSTMPHTVETIKEKLMVALESSRSHKAAASKYEN